MGQFITQGLLMHIELRDRVGVTSGSIALVVYKIGNTQLLHESSL